MEGPGENSTTSTYVHLGPLKKMLVSFPDPPPASRVVALPLKLSIFVCFADQKTGL